MSTRSLPLILVVDDESKIRRLLTKELEANGFDVVCAGDGEQALEVFAQSDPTPDLVLMDVMMPEMDGKEASRKIRSMADKRADSAEIPILAMTAQASTESIHQCELAGMNECIFKPVNAKELIGLLQDIVEKI